MQFLRWVFTFVVCLSFLVRLSPSQTSNRRFNVPIATVGANCVARIADCEAAVKPNPTCAPQIINRIVGANTVRPYINDSFAIRCGTGSPSPTAKLSTRVSKQIRRAQPSENHPAKMPVPTGILAPHRLCRWNASF